jgi:aldehyde dehydrogenase (NAD+)
MADSDMRNDIARVLTLQKRRRDVEGVPSVAHRLERLESLRAAIMAHHHDLLAALAADLGKPQAEAAMDFGAPLPEIDISVANLAEWVKPTEVALSSHAAPGARARVMYEPKGGVLIFGPWNFPFALLMQPLAAAIAAGNTCVLKPSELTPATAAVCRTIVEEVFDESEVAIFEGGADVAELLLDQKFDHIFFTGSPQIGGKIMAAAGRHLASVTLELGGKCPAIIDELDDLKTAADRIAWGKYLNAGQVCLSPDHVWVPAAQRDAFAELVVKYIERSYYPAGALNSHDLAHFANERHLQRCLGLINDAIARGAKLLCGGKQNGHHIEPTVLVDVPLDAAIMCEEIFGPVLPILGYNDIETVLRWLHEHEKPLGLYVFSARPSFVEEILRRTSSGGVTVNDVIQHSAEPNLPFGGVGGSGFGAYHGHRSFLELSHSRSVYYQAAVNPAEQAFRPPYSPSA